MSQHSSLTYCILIVKDQSSFYEICSLVICINIKALNRVDRKQFNIVKTLLKYLENYIVASWRWFDPKSFLRNFILRASSSLVAYKNKKYYVLHLRKTNLIKGDKLSTEFGQLVGMLWWQTLGDESEVIKFHHPRQQMWSLQWEPSLIDSLPRIDSLQSSSKIYDTISAAFCWENRSKARIPALEIICFKDFKK